MHPFIVYAALALAGGMLVACLKIRWSTSWRQLKKYQDLVANGLQTLSEKNVEISKLREADLLLREANRKLREALRQTEATLAERDKEIKELRGSDQRQRAANDKLTEIIGNQDLQIKTLSKDVSMLKTQIEDLRAKLGLPL